MAKFRFRDQLEDRPVRIRIRAIHGVSHNQLRWYMHHLWPSLAQDKLPSAIPGATVLVLLGILVVFVLVFQSSNLVNLPHFCNLCASLLTGTPRVSWRQLFAILIAHDPYYLCL